MYSLYIAFTIFGAGMLIIDLTGILSAFGEDGEGGGDHDGEFDGHGDDDSGDTDADHSGHVDDDHGSALVYHRSRQKRWILTAITALKSLVYFSVGFGATGWFALAQDYSTFSSLLYSIPTGVVTLIIARLVKRLQRRELSSGIDERNLLMSEATVLMPVAKGKIGKVRVHYNERYIDRYARVSDPNDKFEKGDIVRILDMNDQYFFIGLV